MYVKTVIKSSQQTRKNIFKVFDFLFRAQVKNRALPSFFLTQTHVLRLWSLFPARRVTEFAEGSAGWGGAGVRELRGSGHQHLFRDADEVEAKYFPAGVTTWQLLTRLPVIA